MFFLDKVQTPVLIMANDKDGSVPWYQGIEMFTDLRRLQKPAWLLVYNDEDHNLVQRKNRKDLSKRKQQFYDYYLKGAPMPMWMKEGIPAVNKGKDYGFELSGK
jgi:dipeptidyl aminopeptidase/acylaminoacyl peptidase